MVFSSNVFLFLFLPIFLGLYYLSSNRYRNLLILIGSYAFYAWWRVDFLLLFVAVTLWNYGFGLRIYRAGVRSKAAQRWVLWGVVGNLATLGYFKYANFGVENINKVMEAAGFEPFLLTHVILPIGISFYIFQSLSYLIDVYRGDTKPTENLINFAAFIALFPQLIAGPIVHHHEMMPQFARRRNWVRVISRVSSSCWLWKRRASRRSDSSLSTIRTRPDSAFMAPTTLRNSSVRGTRVVTKRRSPIAVAWATTSSRGRRMRLSSIVPRAPQAMPPTANHSSRKAARRVCNRGSTPCTSQLATKATPSA